MLLQFGYGARTCIGRLTFPPPCCTHEKRLTSVYGNAGKNISIMEMSKFVPQMLRKFDLELAEPEKEWTITTRWFSKQTGLNVIFHPRGQHSKE